MESRRALFLARSKQYVMYAGWTSEPYLGTLTLSTYSYSEARYFTLILLALEMPVGILQVLSERVFYLAVKFNG